MCSTLHCFNYCAPGPMCDVPISLSTLIPLNRQAWAELENSTIACQSENFTSTLHYFNYCLPDPCAHQPIYPHPTQQTSTSWVSKFHNSLPIRKFHNHKSQITNHNTHYTKKQSIPTPTHTESLTNTNGLDKSNSKRQKNRQKVK